MKRLWFQYLRNLPFYAVDSVRTWREAVSRLSGYGLPIQDLRVLEIGCGYAYPYVMLFDGAGANTVGIDIVPLTRRDVDMRRYLTMRKRQGLLTMTRRMARDLAFNLSFDRRLARTAAMRLNLRSARLAQMDASRMAFEDASFDFVYSSACFEHLENVPAVTSEIARVLRPGGIAEIEVHLFTSMTGGHDPELYFHQAPSPRFPLWDHLLNPKWAPPVYLNRWRAHEYRDVFKDVLSIREERVTSDYGKQYLTQALWAQLGKKYSIEELAAETQLYVLAHKN